MNRPRGISLHSLQMQVGESGADEAAAPARASFERLLAARFGAIVVVCTTAFLAFSALYALRQELVMDEFDGAYDSYLLRDKLPYVDFVPYKTVLGYYLQLPPLLLARDVWSGLLGTKLMVAVINTAGMALAALLTARSFPRSAVALALPLWVFMSNWLERAGELRVDTLTAWAGLFALFLLLAGRAAAAGCLAAISFLVSQKGVYYFAASLPALLATVVVPSLRRTGTRELLRFTLAYALTLGPYLLLWSLLTSWETTTTTTFLSHRSIIFNEIYPNIRKFWHQTLERNPLFYALALAGLWVLAGRVLRVLARRSDPDTLRRDLILAAYGTTLAACCIWHAQPWPYFFVLLIPTAFVVQVAAIDATARALHAAAHRSRAFGLAAGALSLALLVVGGIYFPATRIPANLRANNGYQRHMVKLASALLRPGEFYIAGMDVLYDHEQASRPLRRMSQQRREQLRHAKNKYSDAIMTELRERPPKLLIRNERFDAIPPRVSRYLRANYETFWGGIALYAPQFPRGRIELTLAFPGVYKVALENPSAGGIRVGSTPLLHGQTIALPRGALQVKARSAGRLLLQAPEVEPLRDRRYRKQRSFVENAYLR